MDNLSPNTVFNGHGSTYLSDNNLNKSKSPGLSQGSKNEPGALQLLFRRQDGKSWIVIERKPSSKVKGYLEKENGERENLVLKGIPNRLKMEHIGNARAVLNDSRISLKGSQIDVFSGLKGGTKRQEEEYEEYGGPQKYKVEITELLHQAFCLNNPESFYNLFRRVRSLKDDKVAYMVTCYDLKDRRFDEIDWMSIAESFTNTDQEKEIRAFLNKLVDLEKRGELINGLLERAAEGGIINAKYELASKGFYNHYYELLEQKYWKAVKDVFFLGVFDFGAMSFLEIGYNNHSLPNQPLTKREIMQLIEKFVLENSPGISIKNCLQDIKSKSAGRCFYSESELSSELTKVVFSMNLRTDGMIDFREDISEDFDESLIKTAEKCMQQVIDKELKSFTYLELAQLAAHSEHPKKQKITVSLVKKANSYEEVAYYYLAQSAIQRGKTEEATEYINQSGWASNFAKLYLKKLKLENSPSAYEKWKDFKKDLNPATLISEIGEFIFYFGSSKKELFPNYVFAQKYLNETLSDCSEESRNIVRRLIKEEFQTYFNQDLKVALRAKLNLQNDREKYEEEFKRLERYDLSNYYPLVEDISQSTIQWIQEICSAIQSSLQLKLLTPPTDFCIFTMGSLARNESGSYTDFEVGVLLEKNTIEAQMYFTEFAQKLSECLYLLGEHPDIGGKGAHLDVADNAPYHKRFEFRNLSENKISNKLRKAIGNRQIGSIPKLPIGGSRVYLLEYRSFAKLFQNEFIDNLKLNGIPELSEDYREKFELHLEEIIERIKTKVDNLTQDDFKNELNSKNSETVFLAKIAKSIKDNNLEIVLLDDKDKVKNFIKSRWGSDVIKFISGKIKDEMVFGENLDLDIKELKQTAKTNCEISDRYKKRELYAKQIFKPLSAKEIQVARSVPELGRNMVALYGYGLDGVLRKHREYTGFEPSQSNVFKNFIIERNKYLEANLSINSETNFVRLNISQRKYVSLKAMVELINKKVVSNGLFSETVRTAIGVFPKKIDLKRDFYRIPEQILTGLYWFYKEVVEKENVDTQNCAQIISKLYESKVFSEELKNKFSFLINLATKFRLRQQYDFKGDCHSIYFDEEAWYKELQELDNKLSQSQEKLNKWESLYKKNQDSSKEYFEEKKNYKKFLKERAYLEKVGPNWLETEKDKKLFEKGFKVLKEIVSLTEKWIEKISNVEYDLDYEEIKFFGCDPRKIFSQLNSIDTSDTPESRKTFYL